VTVVATPVDAGALRLTVEIENTTPSPGGLDREGALMRSMVSTHTVLRVTGGEFVSLADPPPELAAAAAACDNAGTWPALAGEPGSRDTVLSSPIILEDHARVAGESPGDLFDATEIDEILTLRVLTLTEQEKAELRRTDEHARELLERCESLTRDQLLRLHGTLRGLRE
jgi:hydrogenase maturation protease